MVVLGVIPGFDINQIMRQRLASSSRWFANKNNGYSLTVDDLRQILEPDSEDYNPLLLSELRLQGPVLCVQRGGYAMG
jgi:hypothetical protein